MRHRLIPHTSLRGRDDKIHFLRSWKLRLKKGKYQSQASNPGLTAKPRIFPPHQRPLPEPPPKPCFANKETEAQRREATVQKSYSLSIPE